MEYHFLQTLFQGSLTARSFYTKSKNPCRKDSFEFLRILFCLLCSAITDKNWVERDRYSQENVVAFEITDENILLPKTNGNDAPIGDIIQGKPYNVIYYSPIEGVGIKHYNNRTIARVNIDYLRLITQDVDGFKQWLSENPITVLYELAEPIIEELPNSITLQGFNDTTMYIENSITPTVSYGYNALIPYKQELLNQKEEVEVNTLDIENNIIPYLMDMEFNLIMMEDEE